MNKLYLEGYSDDKRVCALDKSEQAICSYVYSHGELEHLAGYDIVSYRNSDGFNYNTDRIEDVIAVLPNGEERLARLFFWTHQKEYSHHHGLLVSLADGEAMKYAEECYAEKRWHL